MPPFSRLVRFLSTTGHVHYGDALLPHGSTNIASATSARIIQGNPFTPLHTVTDSVAQIRLLLCPMAPEDIKTVRCLGLNYARHAKESKMAEPKYPVLFYKPATSISGPTDPIPVPLAAQEGALGMDWECELVAVIGRECSNVSQENALEHVAGYCVGNDVSQRSWQLERGGGQWSLGKGADAWAPIGPGIVSRDLIPDPNALQIWTKVNGKQVQSSSTRDMIFGVAETVSFLSQLSTLKPGDLIFTGTPEGVGMGMNPQMWLKDGDVVEVGLESVGTCVNQVKFERKTPEAKL